MNKYTCGINTAQKLYEFLQTIPEAIREELPITVNERDEFDVEFEGIDISAL